MKIALLPGGFKPPHLGHYNMAKYLADFADNVIVRIGRKERDGIGPELALEIFNYYKVADPDPRAKKLTISIASHPSPVKDVYDFVEQIAPEGSIVILGMGEKDAQDGRYNNIPKFAEPRNIKAETKLVPPQAGGISGTRMREIIKANNKAEFFKYIPDYLPEEIKEEIWTKLQNTTLSERISFPSDIDLDDIKQMDSHIDIDMAPIDIDLTSQHFFDRLNDPRNYPNIELNELELFFNKLVDKKEEFINFLNQYKIIVATDNQTNINIPFMKIANRAIAKTIMRKRNFQTSDPVLPLEEFMGGTMNKQETDKHIVNMKKLRNFFAKQGNKMVPVPSKLTKGLRRKLYELKGRSYDQETLEISKIIVNQFKANYGYEYNGYEEGKVGEKNLEIEYEFRPKPFEKMKGRLFNIEGAADADTILIKIEYNKNIPLNKIFNDLIAELKETIRHELQHIGQFAGYSNIPPNTKLSNEKLVIYYTDPSEVEAHLKGLYKKAKTQKLPLSQVIDDFLDDRMDQLSDQDIETIKKVWDRWIRINLPRLKMNEGVQDLRPKIQAIIKKHSISAQELSNQLKKGTKVEREHTTNPTVAMKIALDHIDENPKYYDILDTVGLEESQIYTLNISKHNSPQTFYSNLYKTLNEITLNKDNAVNVNGDINKGNFEVKDKQYTYEITSLESHPYKQKEPNSIFYNITFYPKENPTDTPTQDTLPEDYIKILSTIYKIILDFTEIKKPDYIGISSIDNNGKNYHKIYAALTDNKSNNIPGYFRKDISLPFTTSQGQTGRFVVLKKQTMNESRLFSKEWWAHLITEELLNEGGAAGHMAHPFDLPNVKTGKDLIKAFEQAAESLKKEPGSVKIDGVNASIRLVNFGGKRQFAMDRGSKKELDLKGITKNDLESRFGAGHGMIKAGGDVLDIFNNAMNTIQPELQKLQLWDDPNVMFNMEYVSGKSNVQDYGKNFLAIHGLLKIETKETEGARGKTLIKRVTSEIDYNQSDLDALLKKLEPFAKKKGFEIYGSVPTTFTKEPNFKAALGTNYTIDFAEGDKTKSLAQWLNDVNDIPKTDRLKMNVNGSVKDVGALSKQVYFAVFGGENIDDLFDNEQDIQKAIQGATTYLATEKLGDAILDVLDSPMGSVNDHEGVVIRNPKISNNPFKITGKFITGGVSSQFQQK